MSFKNFHSHTIFSDGKNTAEEMVREAIRLGFTEYGITDHSFTSFDPDYCMHPENYEAYRKEVLRLKEKYKDQIRLFLGIEQDIYSDLPAEGFEYVIGSVHYVKLGEEYVTVDWGGEEGTKILTSAADRYFGGDIYSLIECYYETVAGVVEITNCNIIGHFDLIRTSNEEAPFFDPSNPRYRAAWKKAVDVLIPSGAVFEINASPLFRRMLSEPFPSLEIQDYIRLKGGRMVYSGDSHSLERLADFADYLKKRQR